MQNRPQLSTLLVLADVAISLTALALAAAARTEHSIAEPWLWGVVIAQVQLASAALVWLRRWLVQRTLVVIATILLGSCLTTVPSVDGSEFGSALLLLSAALFAASWCGAMQFCGWRLVDECGPIDAPPRSQFSLATLLLAMTLVGVYGGLWRSAAADLRAFPAMLAVLLVSSLVGACAFTLATRRAGCWALWMIAIAMLLAAGQVSPIGRLESANILLPLATAQTAILGGTMLVLQIAGARLTRDATTATSARATQFA